jgi:alcohol dehydrogenase
VPGDGVVIEARATGLCRSDWHVWMGHDPSIRLPHVPGHELAGVVATAQSAARRPGDGPVLLRQRRCEPCRQGHTQGCDVAYSPASAHRALRRAGGDPRCRPQLRPPSNGVDFDEAAALGCRFMTACAAVAVRGRVRPGDWLAVHRCGGVGRLAVMLGKALARRAWPSTSTSARWRSHSELGATHAIDARTDDPARQVTELTGGGAHVSIDAIGSAVTCARSAHSLRKRGRQLQVGLLVGGEGRATGADRAGHLHELEVVGVHGMAVRYYPALLRLVASGAVQPEITSSSARSRSQTPPPRSRPCDATRSRASPSSTTAESFTPTRP